MGKACSFTILNSTLTFHRNLCQSWLEKNIGGRKGRGLCCSVCSHTMYAVMPWMFVGTRIRERGEGKGTTRMDDVIWWWGFDTYSTGKSGSKTVLGWNVPFLDHGLFYTCHGVMFPDVVLNSLCLSYALQIPRWYLSLNLLSKLAM